MPYKTIFQSVFESFVQAAFWSTTNDESEKERFLDADYDISDLSPKARTKMEGWVKAFLAEAESIIDSTECTRGSGEYTKWEQAGHDLWLTAARHGAGFWDGDWPEEDGDKLTELAKKHVPEHGVSFLLFINPERQVDIE